MSSKKDPSPKQTEDLIKILKSRFEKNMQRHKGIDWSKVESRLKSNPKKLFSLNEMEITGGEPDVVMQDKKTGEYLFFDCSPETPSKRRSLCYDQAALKSRKENPPKDSAQNMAQAMGITLLSEDDYRFLQTLGEFDTKTSSWLLTPKEIRSLGGALFADRRYDHVFIYHNGADSYYSNRGFRGMLKV